MAELELSREQQRKLAVVAGCNYVGRRTVRRKLQGCHNDTLKIHNMLTSRFGFSTKSIVVMTDGEGSTNPPTGKNLKLALKDMIDNAKEGDNLFFFFSGHGAIVKPSLTQAIMACDANIITCMDFRYLVNRLPKGVTFTIVADSCFSGGLIDKEPVQIGPHVLIQSDDQETGEDGDDSNKFLSYEILLEEVSAISGLNDPDIGMHMLRLFGADASLMFHALPANQRPTPLTADQGILISACEPRRKSYEIKDDNWKRCGAFTKFVTETFLKTKPRPNLTNRQLVVMGRQILGKPAPGREKVQFPCLYCSRKNADALFLNSKAPGRGGSSSQASPEEDDN